MKRGALVFALFAAVLACSLYAQHQHPAPAGPAATAPVSAQAAHHAFLDQERQALERGEGFGMALPADKAGYPGPKHVLELKTELKLTPPQVVAMEKLFAEMKAKAIERGQEVLAAEQRLEEMFREGRSVDELREESFRIATLRAELRWVHLHTHLAARQVLTAEQLATYTKLRHGPSSLQHAH